MSEEVKGVANETPKPDIKGPPASAKGDQEKADLPTLQYRFIGNHAEVLANGTPVGEGDFVDLTEEDVRHPHNETLIHDGKLIGVDEESEHQVSLAARRVERRVNNEQGEES